MSSNDNVPNSNGKRSNNNSRRHQQRNFISCQWIVVDLLLCDSMDGTIKTKQKIMMKSQAELTTTATTAWAAKKWIELQWNSHSLTQTQTIFIQSSFENREINRDKWREMTTKTNKMKKWKRKYKFLKWSKIQLFSLFGYYFIYMKYNNISSCQPTKKRQNT